jgi:hypothetical protein
MEIASYSRYSTGVKAQKDVKKLLKTRQRSMLGAFIIGNGDTNIDPNALLLRKDNTRIYNVNRKDVSNLMSSKKYSFNKAIAYYESVTQIPQASKQLGAYTNRRHAPPTVSKGSVRVPRLEWYTNVWNGNSWVQNLLKEDGGIPCFWTKDKAPIADPFSKAWKLYDAKFPDRGWRITYDVHGSIHDVFSQLTDFIHMHSSEDELHIWIQGTLNGMGPAEVVSDLKRLVANMESPSDDSVKVIIMPSGSGKTTYSRKYDNLVDVDDLFDKASKKDRLNRVETMKDENWELHNQINSKIINDAYTAGVLDDKILLIHTEDALKGVTYEVLDKFRLSKGEMLKVVDERKDNEEWAKMTKLNWSSSNLPILTREDMDDKIKMHVDSLKLSNSTPSIDEGNDSSYSSLWNTPLNKSYDLWELYGGSSPTRIPVIPWRVSNLGPRMYAKGLPPQLFPSSTILTRYGIGTGDINPVEVYGNYSEYVKLVPMLEDDAKRLDYGWKVIGNNMYVMQPATPGNLNELLKVDDEEFFMGCGSVVTAAHGCFGIGRTNDELIEQFERKVNTGHGTSGHMIASVLAFQSHFLWYLEEVSYNIETNSSVYAVRFNEPGSKAYHTIHEYRNAIHDMKRADSNKVYPGYARINLGLCEKFVRSIKL